MADSNDTKYVTTRDGRRITYTRWLYEETLKQESVLANVNDLIMDEAFNAVSVGANFGQQEYGGLLRSVIPNLLDKFGNINATAALKFYETQRDQWYTQNQGKYKDLVRAEKRFATARTKSAIRLNRMNPAEFEALYADDYKLAEKSDRVINFAMKVRAKEGHAPSVSAMNNALTREVASYHRDTILFNAGLDPYVKGVQRVAQATACAFCRLMALGSTNGSVRVSQYAAKYHDHCHCTIQPLFEGDDPVRPPYYDDFEKQYEEVSREQSQFGARGSKALLSDWRAKDAGKQTYNNGSAGWAYKQVAQANVRTYQGLDDFIADKDKWQELATSGNWKENGDELLRYVVEKQGFNAKPEFVDRIEELGENPLFRGINDIDKKRTGKTLVNQFKNDQTHYQGAGIYGNGTYFAQTSVGDTVPAYRIAAEYAGLGDAYFDQLSVSQVVDSGKVIASQLKSTAKTMTFRNPDAFWQYVDAQTKTWDSALAKAGINEVSDSYAPALMKNHNQFSSVMMVLDGIDAYQIESNGYWVVLNRGSLKVLR